jgi:serine/threonine protein kinase
MSFPVPTFWKLAIDSQLFTAAECKQLGDKFAQRKGSDDVGVLTAWLISRGALSRYQGEVLLAGRAGPFVYGDYKIYDRVESKRFARMFRAVHMPTKQRVCLYFLAGAGLQDPDTVARLAQQGSLANRASMGFPHLLRTYEFVDLGSFKFVVLEDMQGKRLERVLSKGPLSAGEACRMSRQAALGIARLYALGMVHGEVRPSNLWLDPNSALKLIHFPLSYDPLNEVGSAGMLEAAQDESIPPEADFLAPELAQGGRDPDMRSDIYSLGCTLYQMLTGKVPFPGGDLKDKLFRHATETPRPVDQLNPAVPAPLAKAVSFMLAKNPDLRFQHTNDVIEALLPFLEPGASQSPQIPVTAISQSYENWLAQNGNTSGAAASATPPQSAPTHATPKVAASAPVPPPAPRAPQPAVAAPTPQAAMPQAPMPQPAMAVPAPWPTQAAPMAMAVPAMAAYPAAPMYPGYAQPAMAVPAYAAPMQAPMAHAMPAQVMSAPAEPEPQPAAQAAPASPRRAPSMASRSRRAKKSQKNNMIAAGVGAGVLLIAGIVLWQAGAFGGSSPMVAVTENNGGETHKGMSSNAEGTKKSSDDKKGVTTKAPEKTAQTADDKLQKVGDNPLWGSPTSGAPISAKYLSPMSHAVIALRPADLLKSPYADGIFDSKDPEGVGRVIGPLGQLVKRDLPVLAGTTAENIKQVLVGILDGMGGPYKTSLVIRYEEAVPGDTLIAAWGNPQVVMAKDSQGKEHNLYQLPDRVMYVPENEKGLVVAILPSSMSPAEITEYLDMMQSNSYSLRPDLELILKASDADRHFTFAFPGNFLTIGSGQDLFVGVAARLKEPLNTFLSVNDAVNMPGPAKAVMLSMHLSDNFFMEMRINPPVGRPASAVAQEFHDRMAGLPRQVKVYINNLSKTPYSSNLLIDFDEIVKNFAAFTRAGADDEQVVLRTYLPAGAGQYLALCTYASLQEGYGGGPGPSNVASGGTKAKTFDDKMATKISLVFDRNPLEVTMQLLSEAMGIEIQILGADLQLDGITKNQSSGMNEKDKPGKEILLGFLGRAHPKLVYFTKPKEGSPGDEILYISSVSGVAARLERKEQFKLPPEFAALATAKPKK